MNMSAALLYKSFDLSNFERSNVIQEITPPLLQAKLKYRQLSRTGSCT
jgi:hypothetical protein